MVKRQGCPHWEHCQLGVVPRNAVVIGESGVTGETMYVGRIKAGFGDMIPGKIVPSHKTCYVSNGSQECCDSSYEVLVNNDECCELQWVQAEKGVVPIGAIEAGNVTYTNEPLYIARAKIPQEPESWHGGKLVATHGVAYIPYDGKEVACREYEVLCQKYIWA